MRPVFADPKTDFVFKRIFGSEVHKPLLIELLNARLELDAAHHIVDLKYLSPEQHIPIDEFKLSVVDVKCMDLWRSRSTCCASVAGIDLTPQNSLTHCQPRHDATAGAELPSSSRR